MKDSDRIKQIRELLSDPKCWTKHHFALSQEIPVRPRSSWAQCWCLYGAIVRVTSSDMQETNLVVLLEKYLEQKEGPETCIVYWNDDLARKHSDVLEFLDYAYEQTVKEEANEEL